MSVGVDVRGAVVGGILLLAAALLLVVSVGSGDVPLGPSSVLRGLVGAADPGTTFIVRDLRLPRALCAALAGLALGVAGAVFQALTRNPLGSPDIVGFAQGASVGALVVLTILDGSGAAVTLGALLGGLVTAALVVGLAGGGGAHRLVLVGIAIGFLLAAVVSVLLARARIEDAAEATRWLLGSLNGRVWEDVLPLLVGCAVLLPVAVGCTRTVRALELGDDVARGLGVAVDRARVGLVGLAVGLVSVSVVAVGPIAFVALTAPQIARRMLHSGGVPIVGAALVGAVVVLAADVVAQRLSLPVGVVTGALGGGYLALLLAGRWSR